MIVENRKLLIDAMNDSYEQGTFKNLGDIETTEGVETIVKCNEYLIMGSPTNACLLITVGIEYDDSISMEENVLNLIEESEVELFNPDE
jgi:hypothetical protein